MHESLTLIYKPILIIKYFRISCVNNILNYMCEFIHFCLLKLINFLLFILSTLFSVFSHHIFLSDLVVPFAHPLLNLLLKLFKLLDLNKLYVFQRALWWFLLFREWHFWKDWICWNWQFFFLILVVWLWRLLIIILVWVLSIISLIGSINLQIGILLKHFHCNVPILKLLI